MIWKKEVNEFLNIYNCFLGIKILKPSFFFKLSTSFFTEIIYCTKRSTLMSKYFFFLTFFVFFVEKKNREIDPSLIILFFFFFLF